MLIKKMYFRRSVCNLFVKLINKQVQKCQVNIARFINQN